MTWSEILNYSLIGLIIVIILCAIIILFNQNNYKKVSKPIKIDKIFCINLLDKVDRWENVIKQTKKYNMDIVRFPAVDCRGLPKMMMYKDYLERDTIKELIDVDRNNGRWYFGQLTPGAVGCYLSHYGIWKKMLDEEIDVALIIEDDLVLLPDFDSKLKYYLKNAPSDWDIICLGWNSIGKTKNLGDFKKLNQFYLLHCYLINLKAVKKMMPYLFPIKLQIDWVISDLTFLENDDRLNVYGVDNDIAVQGNDQFGTTIQIPVSRYSSDSNKHIIKNLK